MGFGFNIFIAFIIFPLTIILVIVWLFNRSKLLLKILGVIWGCIFGLALLSCIVHFFTDKRNVKRDDVYGEYIIDRTRFKGTQADWQYNHYRFEITRQNKFLFHILRNGDVIHTDSGSVRFVESYASPRIIITVPTPRNHIINDTPTLYRVPFSFYYVFRSPKFGSVFFMKNKWKPLDK